MKQFGEKKPLMKQFGAQTSFDNAFKGPVEAAWPPTYNLHFRADLELWDPRSQPMTKNDANSFRNLIKWVCASTRGGFTRFKGI